MKLSLVAGTASKTINVFIQDSSSTTGAGLTGLVFNSAGLTAYYALQRAAAAVITLATQTVAGAYSSGGFVQIDATNMPGWYRLDVPDAALASGTFTSIHLKGATNMAPLPIEIELTAWNNQDAVRGGLTALPNATVSGVGGLLTAPTTANTGLSDVTRYGGTAGTFAAGRPEVNTSHLAGQAVTAAAGVTFPTSVASPTNITAGVITTTTNLTNLPSIPANWLTAAGIATGALTAAKFDSGAIDAAALATTAVDEIRDGVWAKVQVELAVDPGATPTALQAQMLEYMAIRNKRETDSALGTDKIHNSAGAVILTATISDAASVFSKAKYA